MFKEKYLKYKTKYVQLKKQKGLLTKNKIVQHGGLI